MEVTKFGESFHVKETKDTYKITGEITKTVVNDFIISITTYTLNDEYISSMQGDYFTNDNRLRFEFNTNLDRYEEQLEIITLVLDAIKTIN